MREEIENQAKEEQHPPEIYFSQAHPAGEEAQVDCTAFANLGITINGEPLRGKIFTFKLSYSKWIYATIIKGERTQAVMDAIQDALLALDGVPRRIRSDYGKALFKGQGDPVQPFRDLCDHYGTGYAPINPGRPHENGSVETGNRTVKGLLRDRLMTEVNSEFPSRNAVDALLKEVLAEHNARFQTELMEERRHLRRLPPELVETYVTLKRQVDKEGMITVACNRYSAPPEVHAKQVTVRMVDDSGAFMTTTAADLRQPHRGQSGNRDKRQLGNDSSGGRWSTTAADLRQRHLVHGSKCGVG